MWRLKNYGPATSSPTLLKQMKPLLMLFLKFFCIIYYIFETFIYRNEKENEIENAECDTLKQRLREESERVKELSELVDNLKSELIVNRGKIEELEKQIRSKALRCSLKDALVQTDEDDSLTWAKRCSSFEKQIENFNLVNENISESSGNSYESENGDPCRNAVQILNETKYVADVTVQTDRELHLNADDELGEIRRSFEDGLNSNSKECAVAFNTLFDKYLNLLDTYVALHTEFEDYKISEVKDCYSLVNKSVRYLDELCSQLQNSGSGSSIQTPVGTPMSGGTKIEQRLSRLVRTPLKFPFESPNHFRTPTVLNSPGIVNCQSDSSPLMSGIAADKGRELATLKNIYFQKLKTSEETAAEVMKSVAVLEERISKFEGAFPVIQAERDELMKENICLREKFSKISSDITQIRSKLEVEIISLNPNLKATLSDVLIPDLLSLFLHTIMESCKEIQKRSLDEKTLLDKKIEAYEGRLLELNAQISNLSNMVELLNEDKAKCERKIFESEKMEKDLLHQISELIKKTEQYEVEVTHLTEQKEKLSLEVQILHERNAQFKIEVSDSMNEVKCLINEVKYLSQNIEKLEMEIFASVKEKKELLNDLRMLLSKNESYERETSELLTQITERTEQFQAEISELILEKASLLTEVKTLREKNEQYKGEIAESAKDIEIFLGKVTVLTGKIEKYEAELSELAPQKEKLLSEIKGLRDRIDQYEREISESTKLKETLLQEMKVLNNMHETYEKGMFESEKLLENVKELTEMNKLYEAEIMESARVKEELLHVAKNDAYENEEKLLTQIRELKEKNEEYKTEISELVPQKKKLATEICVLRKKTDQYETEILELLMANKSLLEKIIIFGDEHDEYFKNVYECDKLLIHVKTLTNKNRQYETEIIELVSEKERLFDEIKGLRKQIGQYETESFESSKKYGTLLEELKTLREKKETYEKRTYEFERLLADVKELTNKNEEYTVELSETALHKEKLETEVSTLREAAEKYDIEILKLSKANEALLEEIQILKDKHDVHKSQMVTELTKKNEEYESEISALILQKDKLLAENCDLKEMLKHSEAEISEFVKKNEELSHQVKILNDKHEASEKEMCDSKRLAADIKELVETNEEYKTEISKLGIQKEKLVTMVWSFRKRIEQCETEILESLKTVETLLEKIIILEDKHDDYFKSIYEYDKLAIDVRKLTKKNFEYESEISELILQRDKLQTENGELKEMINHSQVDISELAKQNKELSDQMKILGNKQEELMNTNERYKLEIAHSLKAKKELEKLNEANMTKIKENEGLFSIITERNEEYETEIAELVKVKDQLSSQLESLHRITEQYEAAISDSVKVRNDLLNEVKTLRSKNEDHEKELKEMAAKNMLYQSELSELGILKEKLLKEIETLKREKDAEISELATEKEELLKHVDTLNKKITEYEEKITTLSDDMKALNEIKEQKIIEFAQVELKLSNQVKELTNKNEKYRNDMSDLKENLLIEVKALYERIEEYQSEILEATKAKENAIRELKLVSSNNQICERQLSEYRKMLNDATEKADAYEKQVTELIGAKEMLQLEMDALRERSNTFEKAIAECNDEIVKILALTGNQNIQKCTLIKSGTFEVDGKTLFDCFNNWVMLKTNEVEELKSQVKELDEECEMYAQRIREADKETVRALEEGRTVKKKLELTIRDLKEEIASLQKQLENLTGNQCECNQE